MGAGVLTQPATAPQISLMWMLGLNNCPPLGYKDRLMEDQQVAGTGRNMGLVEWQRIEHSLRKGDDKLAIQKERGK